MKYGKEAALSERDALRDTLRAEEGVLWRYHAALSAADSRALRQKLLSLYSAALESHAAVRELLQKTSPVPQTREEAVRTVRKAQKQLSSFAEAGQ